MKYFILYKRRNFNLQSTKDRGVWVSRCARSFEPSRTGVRDGAPQFDDKVVGETEFLQVWAVDGLGKVHAVLGAFGALPDLWGQLGVIDTHEGLEQSVDVVNAYLLLVVGLLHLGCAVCFEPQRFFSWPVTLFLALPGISSGTDICWNQVIKIRLFLKRPTKILFVIFYNNRVYYWELSASFL